MKIGDRCRFVVGRLELRGVIVTRADEETINDRWGIRVGGDLWCCVVEDVYPIEAGDMLTRYAESFCGTARLIRAAVRW